MNSKQISDPCPKCAKPLERRANCFYWRGEYEDAAFCSVCNAIWEITGEEIPPLRPSSQDLAVGENNDEY